MNVAISCSWQVFAVLWGCYTLAETSAAADTWMRQERQGVDEKKVKELWKWGKRLRLIKIRVQQIPVGCE